MSAPAAFPRSSVALAEGLSFADNLTIRSPRNFLRDYPSEVEGGFVNAVVEIPAGACEKWEVKSDGVMRWDMKDAQPRHVKYLGYPCNYGMVPRTRLGKELGGDGDPLDMLVLGPALPRGTLVPVRVLGAIRLQDRGEKDDKLIAVTVESPLAKATTLAELDEHYPGIRSILQTWFENYKGKGTLTCQGFADRAEAAALLTAAAESFAKGEALPAGKQ
ncbi:MAG: inorganic diphosphatase [Planctomycetes bacterium]|nr:inorganic diphosphatase [Planctomycetota bacterium]